MLSANKQLCRWPLCDQTLTGFTQATIDISLATDKNKYTCSKVVPIYPGSPLSEEGEGPMYVFHTPLSEEGEGPMYVFYTPYIPWLSSL